LPWGIEIDNRHALGAIAPLRMTDRNSCIVENTKTHGSGGFCVMTGRADRDERVFRLSRHDLIHRKDCTTRGTQTCLETTGGQHGVVIEMH
jgi:hypothetical protein